MNKVPKVILPVILAAVLLVTGCSASSELSATQFGEPAPDFQLQNLDGERVSLSELRGRPVMLNFWATWCSPCRAEMPYIQEIYEGWTGKPPSVVILAVNVGESTSTAKSFMQNNNLSFPVLLDIKQDVARKYKITAIPTTLFIDKDGIIREKKVGAFRNREEIERYLGKIIP